MPSEDHPIRYRELVAKLKRFGIQEKSGKGVVRKFIGTVEGRKQSFPLHVHSENWEVATPYLQAIRRRFKIPADRFYAD